MVVLVGGGESPIVLDRRRIETADSKIPGSKQPYHAAENLKLPAAEKLLRTCTASSTRMATEAVQAAIRDARGKGYDVVAGGVLTGSGKALPALEKILASHPLLHTAEGELFRNVIITACRSCGLPVTAVKEKELLARCPAKLGATEEVIQQRLVRMGKTIGAPWRQDEKYASLVAWMALAATTS
jgi:hypothetical protein